MIGRVSIGKSSRFYSTKNVGSIYSTLVLSRNPVISADLPKFETQYFKYQNELLKRLMWTFPSWYWLKKGTILETGFRELNPNPVHNNPNLEFSRGRPVVMQNRDRRFKQELKLPKSYVTQEEKLNANQEAQEEIVADDSTAIELDNMSRQVVPNSRTTEADKIGDLTSLERKLARTLYLVISKDKSGSPESWIFPTFAEESENLKPLHTLAEEGLYTLGGENINYFNVSPTPTHVYLNQDGSKEYLIKLHILAGEFVPQSDEKFMWLSKEELGDHLSKEYYNDVKHLLSDI